MSCRRIDVLLAVGLTIALLALPARASAPFTYPSAGARHAPELPGAAVGLAASPGDASPALPIATRRDDTTAAEPLAAPVLAANPLTKQMLLAWEGVTGAAGSDVYARLLTSAGVPASPTLTLAGVPASPTLTLAGGPGHQAAPAVACDLATGEYWLAWATDGGAPGVYLQRLSSALVALGEPVRAGGSGATQPRLACGGGQCVVVWSEGGAVFVQAFAATGAVTEPRQVSPPGAIARRPDVACDAAGRCLVVWAAAVAEGWDVAGQWLDATLAPAGPLIPLCRASGDQEHARVAYNPRSNAYCVAWADERNATGREVWAQIVSGEGNAQGAALRLYAGPARHDAGPPTVVARAEVDQFVVAFPADRAAPAHPYPSVRACTVTATRNVGRTIVVASGRLPGEGAPAAAACPGVAEYLVAWPDALFGGTDLLAQRLRPISGGLVHAGDLLAACASRKGQQSPAVACNPEDGTWLVVWQEYSASPTPDSRLRARLIGPGQDALGLEILLPTSGQRCVQPAVAYHPVRGEYLVVWSEWHSTSTGADIYGQRIGRSGALLGAPFFISRDSDSLDDVRPRVICQRVSPDALGYVVVWQAWRGASWDVCLRRVSGSGLLLGGLMVWGTASASEGAPRLAANLATGDTLVVWRNWTAGDVRARRIDVGGAFVGPEQVLHAGDLEDTSLDVAWRPAREGDAGHAGGYLLAWATQPGDIQALPLDGDGAAAGPVWTVDPAGEDGGWPRVAWNQAAGEWLLLWERYVYPNSWDLHARRFGTDGAPRGERLVVADGPEIQNEAALAVNPATGAVLAVWEDHTAGDWDISGRWLLRGETPTPTPTTTLTPTSTATPTATATATPTVSPTVSVPPAARVWLPVVMR